MNLCVCENLKVKRGFPSPMDYDDFLEEVEASDFTEVPVEDPNPVVTSSERWFRCNQCNQVWRLIGPDYPYEGEWSKVSESKP